MLSQTIGFIGAGQMARALAKGFVEAGLVKPEQIVASDPVPAAAQEFAAQVAAKTLPSNLAVVERASVIFLATKPQSMAAVFAELSGKVSPDKLFVSIAAGVPIAKLSEGLKSPRVVRVMPNTPALVGEGASAYALGPGATAADSQLVGQLLSAVGKALVVEEKLLDAVTGLSGSGPAFVYVMIEALSDGGVRMGLPRDVAAALAAQTVRGAAAMVIETGEHTSVLKDRVASPGGTTIAGLQVLEDRGLRAALIAAVEAATRRSQELGKSA
jgi:pyrroline-5-carboxylate reductase